MITQDEIKTIAREIGQLARAERVILFGSYARATPLDDSDVDLLVVAETNQPRHKRSRELYRHIRPYRFPMDILVYTPREVQRGSMTTASFISQVLREGKVVYVGRT